MKKLSQNVQLVLTALIVVPVLGSLFYLPSANAQLTAGGLTSIGGSASEHTNQNITANSITLGEADAFDTSLQINSNTRFYLDGATHARWLSYNSGSARMDYNTPNAQFYDGNTTYHQVTAANYDAKTVTSGYAISGSSVLYNPSGASTGLYLSSPATDANVTSANAAIVLTQSQALTANDLVLNVTNQPGTSMVKVDYEGDTTISGNLTVSGSSTKGTITLSAGSGTATVLSGATCVCTDSTANASVKCAVSGTTLTATGTGTDAIKFICL